MSQIAKTLGQRIRNYRTGSGMSQERLAEIAGFHPTYIGQLERGEKNATVESVERIARALNVPMSRLFENMGGSDRGRNIPMECYEFLSTKTPEKQEQMYRIVQDVDRYGSL